ncbi:MAG: hypothetical protein J07AB43_16790 [Candidatus Nanosalina sp. J07AB43]|nr:MAG: hypothetical protein J07AB43_16790 [Candidatus Nanosalina sp. J07AB43]
MRQEAVALVLLFTALLVSGCTQSPLGSAEASQEDVTEELNERVKDQATQVEIITVFESSGNTALQIRNTGRRVISTDNVSVSQADNTYNCMESQTFEPTDTVECEVSNSFPQPQSFKLYNLSVAGTQKDSYNCSVGSDQVAC